MKIFTFFIVVISYSISFFSCKSSKTFPHEQGLFPNADEEKWWIVNIISHNKDNREIHLSTLLQQSIINKQQSVAFFTALWLGDEKAYFSNAYTSNKVSVSNTENFPLELRLMPNDSNSLNSFWILNRKNLWLQSQIQKKTTNENISIFAKLKFETKTPFDIVKGNSSEPIINTITPIKGALKLDCGKKYTDSVFFTIHAIEKGKTLLINSLKNYVSLIDFHFDNGDFCTLLLETNANGDTQILNAVYLDANKKVYKAIEVNCQLSKKNIWYSPNSRKNYFLNYNIGIPSLDLYAEIAPRTEDQELGFGKNAFWMGSIEIKNLKTGLPIGVGNMIVLKR